MRATLRATLLTAVICSVATAQDIRYEADAQYVQLVTADSIELATQLWLAIRASVEPKRIRDIPAPEIGFEWEDGAVACRARAVPAAGIDAYGHSAVGYHLEIRALGVSDEVPKVCAEPLKKLREWYFSSASARQVFVRDYRAIDASTDVVWRTIKGKQLMSENAEAESVINSITSGRQ
jgi:hypothetical protein